jgi:hypothetical protein
MAFKKKSSRELDKAQKRADGLDVIRKPLTYGEPTKETYKAKIDEATQKLSAYNTALIEADHCGNEFKTVEKELRLMSNRVLTGVATQFGTDSDEYELVGGTRQSERKHPPHSQDSNPPTK